MSRCLPLILLLAGCQVQEPAPAPVAAGGDATQADAATAAVSPVPAPGQVAAASSPSPPEPVADAAPTHPRLTVDTLDGGGFDLAAERGKWVVVNFWATWCKPCLKEIPDLSAFDAARDDVRVIGLAYEETTPEAMREFLKDHPAGYSIALVDPYDPPSDFETPRGLPMTYLIAPDGQVAKKFLGPITSQDLADAIVAHGKA